MHFEFWPAGHILGSASTWITAMGKSVVYTGDISTYPRASIPDLLFPEKKIDLLLLESTYLSDTTERNPLVEFDKFYKRVQEITRSGNNVLIPCFALGKSQDISKLFVDRNAKEDHPVKLYLDGLVKKITLIYQKQLGEAFQVVNVNGCNFVPRGLFHQNKKRDFLERNPGCVILSSSGMLYDDSASAGWAEQMVEHEQNGLFFTGYLDEESPGKRLLRAKQSHKIRINGQKYSINCNIDRFYISTHSPPSGLMGIIKKLVPKEVILLHGENSDRKVENFHQSCERTLHRILSMQKSKDLEIIEVEL